MTPIHIGTFHQGFKTCADREELLGISRKFLRKFAQWSDPDPANLRLIAGYISC